MDIRIGDKNFHPFLDRAAIAARIQEMGQVITEEYRGKNPLCLAVLNGAFIFAADLFREINTPTEICFVRLASYTGTSSTGTVTTTAGLDKDIGGRHILIMEDIIDTGATLAHFLPSLQAQHPASVKIATFLSKPEARQHHIRADYIAFEIPNRFVVGYGLDYEGQGRNLPDLYELSS
jgi:hypoxanthine phosphoribosyltransferase